VKRGKLAALGVLAVVGALALPLAWMVVSSLEPEQRLFESRSLVPRDLTFEHYLALLERRQFWVPIKNSLIVAAVTTLLAVAIGSAAGYALARLRFRGKPAIVAGVLAIGMFPQISIVPPLYLVLRALGLIDTYAGLVLPYLAFALPLSVYLLYSHFRQLPRELEEAALIDGASRLRALWEVVLPLALPGIATTAILTFVYCWNEFLFALSFTLGPERQTVPVAIALFRGRHQVPWGEVLAASVLATLPVALVVIAFQRRIVRSFGADPR
jgi:ABC-type glycerol-3-phosphate transport system permease component